MFWQWGNKHCIQQDFPLNTKTWYTLNCVKSLSPHSYVGLSHGVNIISAQLHKTYKGKTVIPVIYNKKKRKRTKLSDTYVDFATKRERLSHSSFGTWQFSFSLSFVAFNRYVPMSIFMLSFSICFFLVFSFTLILNKCPPLLFHSFLM